MRLTTARIRDVRSVWGQPLDLPVRLQFLGDRLPVNVRLLDPPLHEFLPNIEDLLVAEALG